MKITAAQTIVTAALSVALFALGALAQTPLQAPVPAPAQLAAALAPATLDQILAPIALYPDPLVAQILMAATYPLEIVEAHRWQQDPNNASLSGDALAAALANKPWDPSVKSLVAFPQVLAMMDGNLDWTERLGDAFLADPTAVSNAIQRLRQSAAVAGTLNTTQQEMVNTTPQEITIEPAMPDVVYVPVYNPALVYGVWPYPGFPPYYFPGYFDGVIVGGIGFGWIGVTVVAPLWGWCRWDWPRHHIDVDRGRFGELNGHHVPTTGIWQHAPDHRHGVPYRNPQVQARFAASARVPEPTRELRGFPAAVNATGRSAAPSGAAGVHTIAPRTAVAPAPRLPPVFESFGNGADVRTQAERGRVSRMTMPAFQQAAPQRGDGRHEYARRIGSSPGTRDGLYWQAASDAPDSPLGPLVAIAEAHGYDLGSARGSVPLRGYQFRILTRQGHGAPGGARDYVVDGHLTGGFAMVAFPARYGDSGVMTFVVNQDGIVFEKNLGPQTAAIAQRMTQYDPDRT